MLDDAICWNQPEGEGSFTEAGNYQYTDERLKLVFLDNQNYAYAEKRASMLMSQSERTGFTQTEQEEEIPKTVNFVHI